jgi:DHA1 family bicyclomycin/chloramphenicol resistance-like MFS transporter
MYLSSLPAISVDLATTPDAAHLTVGAFPLGFCIGMLVYGPLPDQIGRRLLILLGLGLYTVASIGCLLVEDIHALVALRFLQALEDGTAAVLGRTTVTDFFAAEDATPPGFGQ